LKERGEMLRASLIPFLYPVELRYVFKEVKVIRGAELSTDHRLLLTDMRFRKGLPEKNQKISKTLYRKAQKGRNTGGIPEKI
jgi:hypothetical protein